MKILLARSTMADIAQHAHDAYPNECCGMVVIRDGSEQAIRISNVQDLMHQQDPQQFPRSARIAYTMGPDAAPLLLAAERGELELRAIYHSHPEHDAYFSEEDRRQAMGAWDEPSYPDAGQIVVSVYGAEVKMVKGYAWDQELKNYVEAEIEVR